METRVVTAHLPADLAARLDELAARLERPKGWVVKEAVAGYLALEEARHQATLEALADVDAGRTVEHGDIEAWALGLGNSRARSGASWSAPTKSATRLPAAT